MEELYLVHHGVKGQKWGVRRYQNENGSYTNAGKKHRKVRVQDMSDSELRSKINRLQMEQQYKNLTKKPVSAGRKLVTTVLTASITAIGTGVIAKTVGKDATDAALKAYGHLKASFK